MTDFRRSLPPLLLLAVPALAAAAPVVSFTSPGSVRPGETTRLVVRGSGLQNVSTLWTSFPAEATIDAASRKPNAVAFQVKVPADVSPGLNAIRVLGPDGVSALKLFVVDDLKSVDRTSGNDSLEKAQPLELPTAVSGHVDGLRAHFFRFSVEAGQKLTFEVHAPRVGSPLDPMIRLLSPNGTEIAYSDDELGLAGDARLRHEFAEAGKYLLELRDGTYKGSGNHRFHLRIGDFPTVDTPFPMSAQRGTPTSVGTTGPNSVPLEPVVVDLPGDDSVHRVNVPARFADGPSAFVSLPVEAAKQVQEVEPNDDVKSATPAEFGATLHGRFEKPGDVDHFRFTAKKGQVRVLRAITRSQYSATDAVLRVLDVNGRQLATADDTGAADATITFNPPADGEYVVAVSELLERGGPRFAYRVTSTPPPRGFELTLAADHVNVPDTGVGAIAVNVVRRGHNGPIELTAVDLPEGIVSDKAVVGPGQNAGVLTIRSNGHARGTLVPLKIVGRATFAGQPFEATATATAAVKASHFNMAYPPETFADDAVLVVTGPPAFTIDVAGPVVSGRLLSGKTRVQVKRRDGVAGDVNLVVELDKAGLPPNVAAAVKPVKNGTDAVEVAFNGAANAPFGRFTAVLRGTLKQGNTTHTVFSPAFELRFAKTLSPTVKPAGGTVKKGGELRLAVDLGRNPALAGQAEVQIDGLPAGVRLARVGVTGSDNSVTLVLAAAGGATPAEAKNVTVTATTTVGKSKVVEKSAPFTVKVVD